MNKFLIWIGVLSLLLVGARPVKLARFEAVNKAEMKIAIKLEGEDYDEIYYLPVDAGSQRNPTVRTFTLVRDTYAMTLYYLELWDPVYGNRCSTGGGSLDMTRNQRMVFLECTHNVPNGGEPSMTKYGGSNTRRPRGPR